MTRKIALWTVARPMSCGVRTNLRTVRRATATAAGQNLAPGLTRPRAGPGGELVITDAPAMAILSVQAASGPFGWPAAGRPGGEGEEDLIERGAAQRDVLDRGGAVVQRPDGLQQPARPVVHRDRHPARGAVDPGAAAGGR